MDNNRLKDEIVQISTDLGVSPQLVLAIAQVESNLNLFAYRFEPLYRYVWNCKKDKPFRKLSRVEAVCVRHPEGFSSLYGSKDSEWVFQKTSWGAMQVMGAVARENGYRGELSKLCSMEGVRYGIIHLRNYLRRYSLDDAISSYNAGSPRKVAGKYANQNYVNKVKTIMESKCF